MTYKNAIRPSIIKKVNSFSICLFSPALFFVFTLDTLHSLSLSLTLSVWHYQRGQTSAGFPYQFFIITHKHKDKRTHTHIHHTQTRSFGKSSSGYLLFLFLPFCARVNTLQLTSERNEQTSIYFVRQLNFCLSGVTRPCEDTKASKTKQAHHSTADSKYTRSDSKKKKTNEIFSSCLADLLMLLLLSIIIHPFAIKEKN